MGRMIAFAVDPSARGSGKHVRAIGAGVGVGECVVEADAKIIKRQKEIVRQRFMVLNHVKG